MPRPPEDIIPRRLDYGEGIYRRRIRLEAEGDVVRGQLADDFHHFGVELRHDGERVRAIKGNDVRFPWTTCGGSVTVLSKLVDMPITRNLFTVARHTDPRLQCTHLFDLASLAVCHASRQRVGGARDRQFDVALPDRCAATTETTLTVDGEQRIFWRMDGLRVARSEPEIFEGHRLMGAAFNRFVERDLDPDLSEAALVLRRAVMIGLGRQYDFDRIARAKTFGEVVGSACYTFHPDRVEEAERMLGSVRDFTDAPDGLLDPTPPRRK